MDPCWSKRQRNRHVRAECAGRWRAGSHLKVEVEGGVAGGLLEGSLEIRIVEVPAGQRMSQASAVTKAGEHLSKK